MRQTVSLGKNYLTIAVRNMMAMDGWLQHFAYRIELGVGPFVLGSGLAFVIALMTVSTQAWKATRANPAVALRYE